jgi:hypothetical protein
VPAKCGPPSPRSTPPSPTYATPSATIKTPVVPRVCQDGQKQADKPQTARTLEAAELPFEDTMAPSRTRWTTWRRFTHQRSAVRYRPRPPSKVKLEALFRAEVD